VTPDFLRKRFCALPAYQNGSVDADSDLTQSSLADPSKSAVNLPSRLVQRTRPPAGRPSAGQPSAEPKYLRLRKERDDAGKM
jgi:hypothetical protein